MDKTAKLSLISLVIVVGFAAAVGYHYIQGAYYGQSYPQNSFLYYPPLHGSDFEEVLEDGHALNPYLEESSTQYPFLALVGFAFSRIPGDTRTAFLVVTSLSFLTISLAGLRLADRLASATHVFVIAFLSYPFLIAVDRGNFELLVCVLLVSFLFLFVREQYAWSAVCLGLAVALKVYPVVLLALFVPAKRIRSGFLALAVAAVATLGSLLCFEGDLSPNLSFLLQGNNIQFSPALRDATTFSSNLVQRGVSLLTFIKVVSIETGSPLRWLPNSVFMPVYAVSAAVAGAAALALAILIERVLWRRVAILVIVMLLLPPISADYKLLLVYLALFSFLDCQTHSRLDPAYTVIFGLLLIPKSYYYLPAVRSDTGAHDISIAVPANVLLLMLLGLLIVIPAWVDRGQRSHKVRRPDVDSTPAEPEPGRLDADHNETPYVAMEANGCAQLRLEYP